MTRPHDADDDRPRAVPFDGTRPGRRRPGDPPDTTEATRLLVMGINLIVQSRGMHALPLIKTAVEEMAAAGGCKGAGFDRVDLFAAAALVGVLMAHGMPLTDADCQSAADTAAVLATRLADALDA
jgi:hypothetical protein